MARNVLKETLEANDIEVSKFKRQCQKFLKSSTVGRILAQKYTPARSTMERMVNVLNKLLKDKNSSGTYTIEQVFKLSKHSQGKGVGGANKPKAVVNEDGSIGAN